jgi:hypothetical protein
MPNLDDQDVELRALARQRLVTDDVVDEFGVTVALAEVALVRHLEVLLVVLLHVPRRRGKVRVEEARVQALPQLVARLLVRFVPSFGNFGQFLLALRGSIGQAAELHAQLLVLRVRVLVRHGAQP